MRRRRLHRATFVAAGAYNIVWGCYAVLDPQWFFRLTPAAAVGLTGKILGPLGLAWLIATGVWPTSTVVIVATNDLIWWVPFGYYLLDAWTHFRASWRSP
ncbi:MAG: hypothetical protein V7603_3288 [Micromonosporaceae bacterium]